MPFVKLTPKFEHHTRDYARVVAWSNDGRWAAVGDAAGVVTVFDGQSLEVVRVIQAHQAPVTALAFRPGGAQLASGGEDARVVIHGLPTEATIRINDVGAWVEGLAWPSTGECLAYAAGRNLGTLSPSGEGLARLTEPSTVLAIAATPVGARLAATCYGRVRLYTLPKLLLDVELPLVGSQLSLVFSPDGKILATGCQDCSVHFWRLPGKKPSVMSGYAQKPVALSFDRRALWLATGGGEVVTCWSFKKKGPEGTEPLLLEGHSGPIRGLAFNPTRDLLASGDEAGVVCWWQPGEDGRPLALTPAGAELSGLAWRPDGQVLLTADAAGRIAAYAAP